MKGGGSSNKGESHRIYWQQWPSSASSGAKSRRDLITSSAAIRISPDGALAQDVTNLLCETLNLESNDKNSQPPPDSWDQVQDAWNRDCLVLVGTLYSLPLHYVRFQHELEEQQRRLQQQQQQRQQQLLRNASQHSGIDTATTDETNSSVHSGSSGNARGVTSTMRSDPPFHVVRTLSANDNPLEVRDKMIHHLQRLLQKATVLGSTATDSNNNNVRKSNIAPKLQWFFVPGINHPASPIPCYIDLDGYSSSMEDSDEEEEEEEDENDIIYTSAAIGPLEEDFNDSDSEFEKYFGSGRRADDEPELHATHPSLSIPLRERELDKQRQRYYELSIAQSALQHHCISGYLLKQSMKDPHVWKRVHCVLTDDQLWFVSRIGSYSSDNPSSATPAQSIEDDTITDEEKKDQQSSGQPQEPPIYERPQHRPSLSATTSICPASVISYAKHRRLGLTRALLMEPSQDGPLARTPFAFEVIASNGIPHRFRATSQNLYARWVGALKARIVQSYENSLMDHAGLIVKDETEARNKRYFQVAIEPLWNTMGHSRESPPAPQQRQLDIMQSGSETHDKVMQVVRFGMEVAEYREQCRHIQAILPAKQPVMAMTSEGLKLRRNRDPENDNGKKDENEDGDDEGELVTDLQGHSFRLDGATQTLIQSAWDEAVRLGGHATKLAMQLQDRPSSPATENGSNRSTSTSMNMPRSLETICRHLEYVISGSFRKPSESQGGQQQQRVEHTRHFPPPVDLFDAFLAELQAVAVSSASSFKTKKNLFLHRASTDDSQKIPKVDESSDSQSMNGKYVH